MRLFDTHVHLDDDKFDTDRDGVIQRAQSAGVVAMVAVGTTAASSAESWRLARENATVYAAAGIQPNYAAEATADDWRRIQELVTAEEVVAIGETGIDHHWDFVPLEIQREWFIRHVELSLGTGLPIVIHMREGKHGEEPDSCCREIISLLRTTSAGAQLKGVMHSYTGGSDLAAECLQLGLNISFAGMVTFKNAKEIRMVARTIPADRLLIETDAPYLTPHPHRGQSPNEPRMLVHTARILAETRGVAVETFAEGTTRNACRLFGLPELM